MYSRNFFFSCISVRLHQTILKLYRVDILYIVTLCRTREQDLRASANCQILWVKPWTVYSQTLKLIVIQLQQVSAPECGWGSAHHIPGMQAPAAVVHHTLLHAAHPKVTLPPVPIQPNVHLDVAQREVCRRMEAGQHVEAQIQDL